MSEVTVEMVQALIDRWQPRLRLSDWRIAARVAPVDDDHGAEAATSWRSHSAAITVPADHFARLTASLQCGVAHDEDAALEESVVHELLHVTEYPLADQFGDELEWMAGKDSAVTQPATKLWRDYREWWINRLTLVLIDAYKKKEM